MIMTLAAVSEAATTLQFQNVPVTPGGVIRAEVPLSAQEQTYASERGNQPPAHAIATLAVPQGFDPNKSWPVLIVLATTDGHRRNGEDLVSFYLKTALSEGWVLLAGDGPVTPQQDSSAWRSAMTLAAVDALQRSFPASRQWRVACAGFSGGAKTAGIVAPLLAVAGCHVNGIYLTGINQDQLGEGYRRFHPGTAFLQTPIFISSGQSDPIAALDQQMQVKLSLQKTGFSRVRFEMFPGRHSFKLSHLLEALRWFRQLQS